MVCVCVYVWCLSMSDTSYSTNKREMLCREPEHRAFEPKNQFRTMVYIAVELVDRTNGSVL